MLYRLLRALVLALLPLAAPTFAQETRTMPITVVFETNHGPITLELYPDQAPKTVANFTDYVRAGQYNGTVFHRVIPGFMAQGGGFTAELSQKPVNAPITNEADNGLKNDLGTLAMARTNDPHSASSQFFINVSNNDFLNHSGKNPRGWGYAVFGRVVEGMDVVEQIKAVPTGNAGFHQDVPTTPVEIERVTVSEVYRNR